MGHNKGSITQTVIPDTQAEANVSEAKQAGPQQEQATSKLPNVYQRWNAVLAEVKSIAKLGENEHDNYDYLQATDVLKELRPLIAKHGLILKTNPIVDKTDDSEYESRSKATMHFVRIFTEHWLINCDAPEDRVELLGIGDAADVSDKALNKARTGALKYVLRDNFLIDGQDVAETEKQTSERTGPQNKVGQQQTRTQAPSSQEPPVQLRSQKFTGSVVECGEGENEEGGKFKWFLLHDQHNRMFTFREQDFQWIANNNRLVVTCEAKPGKQGKFWWQVTDLAAPLTPDFINTESTPAARPVIETAEQILKRMYPTPQDAKRRRLTELALHEQPEALWGRIMQLFEIRIKSEKPSGETGMLSCLDLAITAATEEASELFPAEGATTQ